MGNVRLGVDPEKTLALRDQYGIKLFVETGTYKGGTTRWALPHFDKVVTIEGYAARYGALVNDRSLSGAKNLAMLYGDSRTELRLALELVEAPAVLWLDAHWCGPGAHDCAGDECPLREELNAVLSSAHAERHVVMIDDARLFLAPPPYPHDPAQWMTMAEITAMLAPRRITVVDDVIYADPLKGAG